jgi:hypothetical protein
LNARALGHIAKFPIAFVVKKMIAVERGNVHIVAAIIVVVGDGDAHAVHFDVETAAARNIGESAVVVVAIERRQGLLALGRPVLAVDQQNIRPAVAIGVEESAARAQRFRQIFLARPSAVMREVNASLRRDVGKDDPAVGCFRRAQYSSAHHRTSHQPPATHFTALS